MEVCNYEGNVAKGLLQSLEDRFINVEIYTVQAEVTKFNSYANYWSGIRLHRSNRKKARVTIKDSDNSSDESNVLVEEAMEEDIVEVQLVQDELTMKMYHADGAGELIGRHIREYLHILSPLRQQRSHGLSAALHK